MDKASRAIEEAIKSLFEIQESIELERTDPKFGDFACNIAMKLGKKIGQNPLEIAENIKNELIKANYEWLGGLEIAGPGFINIKLSDKYLVNNITEVLEKGSQYGKSEQYINQSVLVEYLDPNPFKELHIGHVYAGTVGDAIACLFEAGGANVHRVTYQGDVGLHVAKAIYGIMQKAGKDINQLEGIESSKRPGFLSETYVIGAKAFRENEQAKQEIREINRKIYDKSDPIINQIHDIGFNWSMVYFEEVYKALDFTTFEKNYMEGTVAKEGLELVKQHISDGVFEKSEGAIVFRGDKFGLHTRVFINSQGLPTYDAKDLGNAMLKMRDYAYTRSIIITGQEQAEYFKVMLKALEQFAPEQASATTHIPHGLIKLSTGKMSSRTGEVMRALDLLREVEKSAKEIAGDRESPIRETTLAAIKYVFLKSRITGDIVYDVDESLSLEGNSGPYLQYAHARARSILAKSQNNSQMPNILDAEERVLTVKIEQFEEVVDKATNQLAPHIICTYLFELAQIFNRFYEKNRIIGDVKEAQRLSLVAAYATVLKNGLEFIKIPAPEKM
jgi:arginyl-tRNA synthetase